MPESHCLRPPGAPFASWFRRAHSDHFPLGASPAIGPVDRPRPNGRDGTAMNALKGSRERSCPAHPPRRILKIADTVRKRRSALGKRSFWDGLTRGAPLRILPPRVRHPVPSRARPCYSSAPGSDAAVTDDERDPVFVDPLRHDAQRSLRGLDAITASCPRYMVGPAQWHGRFGRSPGGTYATAGVPPTAAIGCSRIAAP